MKPRLKLHIRGFGTDLGWFPGEPFRLLKLALLEWQPDCGAIYVVDLQIAWLMLTFYLDTPEPS